MPPGSPHPLPLAVVVKAGVIPILASVAIRAGFRSGTTYFSTGATFAYCAYVFRLAHSFRLQGHAHERQNQALDHYSQNLDLDRSKQLDTQLFPQSQ